MRCSSEARPMACVVNVLDEGLGVDWTQLLPEPCRLLILQCMDSISRAAWRVVSKQACQDVYVATTRLTWHAGLEPTSTHMSVVPLPLGTPLNPSAVSRPSQLLSKLTSLQHLSCRHMYDLSSIQGIPSTLRSLDLSNCRTLADLSPLQHCYMLEQLTVHAIHHTPACMAESFLGITPKLSSSLRRLTMQLLFIKTSPSELSGLILRALAHLPRLQQLRLRLLGIRTKEQWQMGAEVIGQLTDLQLLALSSDLQPVLAMTSLAPAIGQLKQLRSLEIANIPMSNGDAAALSQAVMSLPPQLTLLGLDRCSMSVTGAAALSSALQAHSVTLRSLQLFQNNFTMESIAALVPGFKDCTALTDLILSGNRFADDQGATALAAVLCSVAPSLTSLDLSCNELGGVGAAIVATALRSMTALQHLKLFYNRFGAAGMQVLASAFRPLPLRVLYLCGTGLGSEGAQVLASALGGMTTLRHVIIGSDGLGDDGEALIKAAATAPGLTVEFQ